MKLTARDGHELACGACGAPLHEMKWLKASDTQKETVKRSSERRAPHGHAASSKPIKKNKKKRRKPMWKNVLGEVWDEIEDIFD